MKDFWHIVVIILGLIALYLLLNSKTTVPVVDAGFAGATSFAKVLQGR